MGLPNQYRAVVNFNPDRPEIFEAHMQEMVLTDAERKNAVDRVSSFISRWQLDMSDMSSLSVGLEFVVADTQPDETLDSIQAL
jgi:hypothetical protein